MEPPRLDADDVNGDHSAVMPPTRIQRRGFMGKLGTLFSSSAASRRRDGNSHDRSNSVRSADGVADTGSVDMNNSVDLDGASFVSARSFSPASFTSFDGANPCRGGGAAPAAHTTRRNDDGGLMSPLSFATVNSGDDDVDELFQPARSFNSANSFSNTAGEQRPLSARGATDHTEGSGARARVTARDGHAEMDSDVQEMTVSHRVKPQPALDDVCVSSGGPAIPALPSSGDRRGASGFDLLVSHLSMRAPRRFLRRSSRELLHHVTTVIPAGTLCCVLCIHPAPPHALLSALAGLECGTSRSCVVMGNELPTSARAFRRHVALVTSTEGCSPHYTARENLLYAIRMRCGGITAAEELSLAYHAAELTCLLGCLDAPVEALSRAQQYQLAVAMELVLEPCVVLLDDPMRYYDHGSLHILVALVRNLMAVTSRRVRRTVVFTGATLPWLLFDATDQLVLLSAAEGRLLYTGTPEQLAPFFRTELGIPNIQGETVADLLAQLEDSDSVSRMAVAFANSSNYRWLANDAVPAHLARAAATANGEREGFPDLARLSAGAARGGRPPPPPNYRRRWVLLWQHTSRPALLSAQSVMAWAALLVAFMVILAVANGSEGVLVSARLQNRCGVVFALVSGAMQMNTMLLRAEVREHFLFLHQKSNRYFSTGQYFSVTLLRLLLPRLTFCVAGGLSSLLLFRSAASVVVAMVLGMTSFAHGCLTLAAVSWYPNQDVLLLAGYCYFFYSAVTSGFLVSLHVFPPVLSGLSLLRWGYGGIVSTELAGLEGSCVGNSTAPAANNSTNTTIENVYCTTSADFITAMGLGRDSWLRSVAVLFVFSVIMLCFLGTSLRFASSVRKQLLSPGV